MRRPTTDFGPEWNPVLIVLACLALLCALAMAGWWLGLAGIVGAIIAFAWAVWE